MSNLNQLTTEAISILRCIHEDQLEDRSAYRNEIRRLTLSGLSLAFSNFEHFLDRYGYLSIDQRSDTLQLTSNGLEAVKSDIQRLKSLNDDVLYHFSKEIKDGVQKSAPTTIKAGKRFDHHYIRFEGIGRGGLGSVWRAEHLKTGRRIAIKTLEGIDEIITSGRKSTLKKRLERVIRQLAQLNHPFICPILDLSVHHTPPYYVMPLYSGGSLRDLIRSGPISPEVGLNLFNQICLGVQHAHQQSVPHLDLKPENILLDERGNVRLFDFGISRAVARQIAQVGRQSYVGFGSVAYMAPELMKDPTHEAESVDIYSLGLLLYEILIGELPGRRSPMPSQLIEGLPEPIDELFDLMTQDRVERRPRSMSEVLEILNRVPPFDRLSSQAMVMTFHQATLELPGLKSLDIPELEETIDIQRHKRVDRRDSSSLLSSSAISRTKEKISKEEAVPSSVVDQLESVAQSTEETALSATHTPATSSSDSKALASTETLYENESNEEGQQEPQETPSLQPSPTPISSLQSTLPESAPSILNRATDIIPQPLIHETEQSNDPIDDEDPLIELEELEDDELLSSAPLIDVMSSTPNPARHNLIEEAEEALEERLTPEDEFAEDATTSLQNSPAHTDSHSTPSSWPPSPTPLPQTKRSSTMTRQLLERKRREQN